MPQGRVPDRRKSVVCSLLRVLQRRSKIFHSALHAKGRRPCQEALKPHLTHCCSIYYICVYQILSLLLRHEKGLLHGIEKRHRGGPGETHPKTQAAPSGNGARRGSRLHGARGETSRADPCRRCLEPQSCPQGRGDIETQGQDRGT